MAEGLRAATSRLVRYLAPVGLKQSPLRRFCEDGFLGFRVKTAIPGLIEAMPAKRGVGADRRLSLSGKPVVKPGLVRSRSYAHSPSACSPMARSDAHRWQIVTPRCSNCWPRSQFPESPIVTTLSQCPQFSILRSTCVVGEGQHQGTLCISCSCTLCRFRRQHRSELRRFLDLLVFPKTLAQ